MEYQKYIITNSSEFEKLNLENVIYKISEDNAKLLVIYEDETAFNSPMNLIEGPSTMENFRDRSDISYWCKYCKK